MKLPATPIPSKSFNINEGLEKATKSHSNNKHDNSNGKTKYNTNNNKKSSYESKKTQVNDILSNNISINNENHTNKSPKDTNNK